MHSLTRTNKCETCCADYEQKKALPEAVTKMREEGATFEGVLASLAHLRLPMGLNDFGVYELKEEYYASVDPYFWHYSCASREKVEAILSERRNAASSNIWEFGDAFKLPQVLPISLLCLCAQIDVYPNDHIMKPMERIICCPSFLRLVIMGLRRVIAFELSQFERITMSLLQLVAIACRLSSDRYNFFEASDKPIVTKEKSGESLDLLNLLLFLLSKGDEAKYRVFVPILKSIVREFELAASSKAHQKIASWRASVSQAASSANSFETEVARQKKATAARQQKLKMQFRKQQKLFLENSLDDGDNAAARTESASPDFQEEISEFKTGTCIICSGMCMRLLADNAIQRNAIHILRSMVFLPIFSRAMYVNTRIPHTHTRVFPKPILCGS